MGGVAKKMAMSKSFLLLSMMALVVAVAVADDALEAYFNAGECGDCVDGQQACHISVPGGGPLGGMEIDFSRECDEAAARSIEKRSSCVKTRWGGCNSWSKRCCDSSADCISGLGLCWIFN